MGGKAGAAPVAGSAFDIGSGPGLSAGPVPGNVPGIPPSSLLDTMVGV
jgi:hypothetical protein